MAKERRGMLVQERIDVVKDPRPKKENRWDGGLIFQDGRCCVYRNEWGKSV